MPSRRTVSAKESIPWAGSQRVPQPVALASVGFRRVIDLPRILHHIHLADIDIDELAVALLDLPDIDVLDDVALDRVDLDGPARAVELLAPEEVDVFETVGIGAER